jgi:L-threonylcarbamoyladenylate synthase
MRGAQDSLVRQAAQALAAGHLVAFPTETVYGLGADAQNDSAVAKIFVAKGRPADHPLIVHVRDAAQVHRFAADVPDFAHRLMAAFWPGPLTVIVPRRAEVALASAGGQDSIGLRCPAHPMAQALLEACAKQGVHGVSAPSANKFGKVSPTTAAHVRAEFGADLRLLDGGACQVGIESTIIDCTRGAPVLLRPGMLTREHIQAVLGQPLLWAHDAYHAPAPRVSGSLASHYAPQARLRLMDAHALQHALDQLSADAQPLAIYARSPLKRLPRQVLMRTMPQDAAAAAQQLFSVLRELDAHQVHAIWVETPADEPAWEGVRDRLQRASA